MQIRVTPSKTSALPIASSSKSDRVPLLSNDTAAKNPKSSARFGFFYNNDKKLKPWTFVVAGIMVVVLAGGGYFAYNTARQNSPAGVQGASTDEVSHLLQKVGTLILLPTSEQPTVATVSDKDKLKDQPFFTNAETGDKLIIYPNAKKAILYRPNINKIIEVAPVSFGDTTTTK